MNRTGAALTTLAALAVLVIVGAVLTAPRVPAPTSSPLPSAAPPTATPIAEPLPPGDAAALAAIFDPIVAPLDLRFTRGSLLELGPGNETPGGPHLALYVEPTAAYSDDRYTRNLIDLSVLTVPYVFERWHGLVSMDICQEPPPGVDDDPLPPPETQIFVDRDGAGGIDWPDLDLTALARAFVADDISLALSPRLARHASWVEALRAAEAGGSP